MSDQAHAFARAAQARDAIEHIVSVVRSGEADLTQAYELGDNDELMGRVFAVKIFEVVPGIGKVRARRTIEAVGLAEDIWLRDVPEKQRKEIVEAFSLSQ